MEVLAFPFSNVSRFIPVFAQHFFDRVEETFVNENNPQKMNEFLAILRCFDATKENGGHLYLVNNNEYSSQVTQKFFKFFFFA